MFASEGFTSRARSLAIRSALLDPRNVHARGHRWYLGPPPCRGGSCATFTSPGATVLSGKERPDSASDAHGPRHPRVPTSCRTMCRARQGPARQARPQADIRAAEEALEALTRAGSPAAVRRCQGRRELLLFFRIPRRFRGWLVQLRSHRLPRGVTRGLVLFPLLGPGASCAA